jgi:hypothetical protein
LPKYYNRFLASKLQYFYSIGGWVTQLHVRHNVEQSIASGNSVAFSSKSKPCDVTGNAAYITVRLQKNITFHFKISEMFLYLCRHLKKDVTNWMPFKNY